MRFSLIMPTINRVDEPKRFLDSLTKQTYPNFELIVVDQNPDERLTPILAMYEDKFPILHLRLKVIGASRARNAGLEYARGDLVAFPDDDCLYLPNVLTKVAGFFAENPAKDGLNGRSVDETGNSSMASFDTEPGLVNKRNIWERGIEYSMFLKRKSLRNTWFDEEIGPASGTPWLCGEGTDYLLRLLEQGSSIHYDPDVVLVHPSTTFSTNDKNMEKAYSYGCGMGHVLKKHEFPLSLKAKFLYRPIGGAMLALVSLNSPKARYYLNLFKGRLRGLL